MTAVACLKIILVAFAIEYLWGLQVIPERANVVSYNEKYGSNVSFYIKRYSRRSNYYINLEGTTKHVWNNNVSAHLYFYEFLHNEYKRSFVEMHFKLCDMLNKDPYVGKAVAATGATCPLPAGIHKLLNITVPANNFPNVWPYERCKVDIKLEHVPSKEEMCNFELYLLFKQKSFY